LTSLLQCERHVDFKAAREAIASKGGKAGVKTVGVAGLMCVHNFMLRGRTAARRHGLHSPSCLSRACVEDA
jgi:hypothetical protein